LGQITFQLFNLRALTSKTVYALLDAELDCDGIVIRIFGLQARHVPGGGTSIHLPCFRDADGVWRAAVDLPDELKDALATAALEFLIEEGVARTRDDVRTAQAAAE
jgi:stage V sporulation protein G